MTIHTETKLINKREIRQILAEMEQFQANCEAREGIDTDIVHELIFDWRCRLNELLS